MNIRKRQPQTDIVVAIADTHCNSTVALCPPVVEKDDGGMHTASESQKWLWKSWLDLWNVQVPQFKKSHKAKRVITFVLGDAVEGNHHGSTQTISTNVKDQQRLAIQVFDIAAKQSDKMLWIRGTPAHTGSGSFTEELLAADFDNTHWRNENSATWPNWTGEIQGVRFSLKHHRRQSRLPWTINGSANRLAAQIVYDYASESRRPHLVLRAHGHKIASSGISHKDKHNVQVLFLPAWKLIDEFVNRIESGDGLSDIGAYMFACCSGEYIQHHTPYKIKGDRKWETA